MSPFRRLAAGMAVAAVAVLATAVPASAHDQLIFSDPAIDAQLEVPPDSVTMRFSGELITLGGTTNGAVVLVVDDTGRDWVDGDVEVLGDTVTVELAPDMPEAGYQARWQVISEDGHPISGIIPFTVGDAEPMASTSSGTTPDRSDGPPETADQAPAGTGDVLRELLIGAGGAAVAVVVFVLYRLLRRPRAAAAAPEPGATADEHSERQKL